ncbi:MAG TPA: glycosyltransferase [Thermoanaerobaculia bacterium]|nr:glycosyltransferase [Thermoanaerobaculia bacterium]
MTSGDRPALTVFTPFYKTSERYFDETIESVLSQSFGDFEYLMINDGPAADARRIEEKFPDPRIRIITTGSPLGLSGSRNAGLLEARGDLIAFIDSDDFCEPGRFQKQIDFLRAHPDHILVGSAIRYIDEQSRTIGGRVYPETDDAIRKRLVAINCIAQPSVMARRQALIDAGGYTPDFPCAEDYALWLRLARFGKFHNLQETLVAYRIHLQSGKHLLLRPALRDTTRLKLHAIRHYGFRPTPRALASIAAHLVLLMLPSRVVYWLFRRIFVT